MDLAFRAIPVAAGARARRLDARMTSSGKPFHSYRRGATNRRPTLGIVQPYQKGGLLLAWMTVDLAC